MYRGLADVVTDVRVQVHGLSRKDWGLRKITQLQDNCKIARKLKRRKVCIFHGLYTVQQLFTV